MNTNITVLGTIVEKNQGREGIEQLINKIDVTNYIDIISEYEKAGIHRGKMATFEKDFHSRLFDSGFNDIAQNMIKTYILALTDEERTKMLIGQYWDADIYSYARSCENDDMIEWFKEFSLSHETKAKLLVDSMKKCLDYVCLKEDEKKLQNLEDKLKYLVEAKETREHILKDTTENINSVQKQIEALKKSK